MTVDTRQWGIPDPESDLFSDAMDAAAGAFCLAQWQAKEASKERAGQSDGEKGMRRALAAAFKAFLEEIHPRPAPDWAYVDRATGEVWIGEFDPVGNWIPPKAPASACTDAIGAAPADPLKGWRPITGDSPEGDALVNVLSCTGRVGTIDAREARRSVKIAQAEEDRPYWTHWQATPALPENIEFLPTPAMPDA